MITITRNELRKRIGLNPIGPNGDIQGYVFEDTNEEHFEELIKAYKIIFGTVDESVQ